MTNQTSELIFTGGLNENKNDGLDSLYRRILGLDREDYAVPASQLQAELGENGRGVQLAAGDDFEWAATPYAVGQLSDRVSKGLRSFGNEMIEKGHTDLYVDTLNRVLGLPEKADQKFQVRTIQPNGSRLARAVVSDKFKPVDDNLCVPPMVDLVSQQGQQWRSLGGQITDTRTYLRFLNREPSIRNIGPNNRNWFLGFQYSNSEVGQGSTSFHLFFYDDFCENGCVFGQKSILDVSFRHVGAKIKTGFGVVTDERIQEAELASIQGMIQEATQKVLSKNFADDVREYVERGESRRLDVSDKPEAIRQVANVAGLSKSQQDNVVAYWDSREDNALGVSSAITRLAQQADTYGKRVDLEAAGGKVLELSDRQWNSVMALAS